MSSHPAQPAQPPVSARPNRHMTEQGLEVVLHLNAVPAAVSEWLTRGMGKAESRRRRRVVRPLLDAPAAAALFGVPASWLLAQARRDAVPHRRIGKYVRFDEAELEQWAASRARGPRSSARPDAGKHPASARNGTA